MMFFGGLYLSPPNEIPVVCPPFIALVLEKNVHGTIVILQTGLAGVLR